LRIGCCRLVDVSLDVFQIFLGFCGFYVVDGALVSWFTIFHEAAKDAHIDITVFCGEIVNRPPVHIVDFPVVFTKEWGVAFYGEDKVCSSPHFVYADIVSLNSETSLFPQFSFSALDVCLVVFAVSFWERPFFTQSPVDEEDFSKLVDEDTTVYS
jgi:hypothetical protein